jgi:hypothetical protein
MGIFATGVTSSMLLILARKSNIAARRRETEVLETSAKAFSKSALVLLALAVTGTPAHVRCTLPAPLVTSRDGSSTARLRRLQQAASWSGPRA